VPRAGFEPATGPVFDKGPSARYQMLPSSAGCSPSPPLLRGSGWATSAFPRRARHFSRTEL